MANREQRSNREKKKPKAEKNNEKNKKKGGAQPVSPFASTRMPRQPIYDPAEKKSP